MLKTNQLKLGESLADAHNMLLSKHGPSAPSSANQVRMLLTKAGLTQAAAAGEIGIDERTMRHYCGGSKVPRYIILALEHLVATHQCHTRPA